MVFSRRIATRLQPYFGYRNESRLKLSLRALQSADAGFAEGGSFNAFRKIMAQFDTHEVAGLSVRLVVESNGVTVVDVRKESDSEGFVHFDEAFTSRVDLPASTRWESARLEWLSEEGLHSEVAQILAPGATNNLAVISDIDDTIIESGITGGLGNIARNWKRVLAQLPDERHVVPGAIDLYAGIGGRMPEAEEDGLPAPSRPFFYVSSSPWNLFTYILAFQDKHRLPFGPLHLRDWGLNSETFGSSSHGAHKRAAIGSILDMYPDTKFAMIGDDTQGDLPAFAEAVSTHPGQVAAIFMRKAAGEEFTPEEVAAKKAIESDGIPLWFGASFEGGQEFLESIGLAHDNEAEEIVHAVESEAAAGDEATA